MAQTTDTNNANGLARATFMVLQGRVDSDTAAHHGCGVLGWHRVGDLDGEVLVHAVVISVPAIGFATFGKYRTIGVDIGAFAIAFLADGAVRPVSLRTASRLGTNTSAVTQLVLLDILTYTHNGADNPMADAAS